ncbi:MAG: ClpP family protease [Acutalibacteraceae bacterium]
MSKGKQAAVCEDENNGAQAEEINDSARATGTGAVLVKIGGHIVYCLTIIGQIEGHSILPNDSKTTKYEHVIPQLVAAQQSDRVEGILLLLNTAGGDVEAGLAIAELISGIDKPTVSLVLGGGHSIGIPLAVSTDYSFIAKTASMTVHPVRTTGLTIGVPQTFEYFRRLQQRINGFVAENSDISSERYNRLAMNTGQLVLDVGTVLDGEEAVEEGIIDEVGSYRDAAKKLCELIEDSKKAKKKK